VVLWSDVFEDPGEEDFGVDGSIWHNFGICRVCVLNMYLLGHGHGEGGGSHVMGVCAFMAGGEGGNWYCWV